MAGKHVHKGEKVEWRWGANTATGKVAERFEKDVTRTIKGTRVTRKASPDAPAYLVEQADGDKALKSESELMRRK